jgi:hypothetical protein
MFPTGPRVIWHLQTFDVNEAGQVHTYLRYLAYLPYKEQLYWQSFNEWPKGPISKRAFRTDLEGEFYSEYDPLISLKRKLRDLDDDPPPWWQPRGAEIRDQVRYPATASSAEWGNEILALDQYVVEGFKLQELRKLAASKGRLIETQWGSLKVLEECLLGAGIPQEQANNTVSPLRAIHELRTIVKGHAASSKKADASRKAKRDFGTFRTHFSGLVAACDRGIEAIITALI